MICRLGIAGLSCIWRTWRRRKGLPAPPGPGASARWAWPAAASAEKTTRRSRKVVEPFESALDVISGAHPYPRTSRYHDAEIGIHRMPDGTEVRYTKHRLLPSLPHDPDDTVTHTVSAGERPDHLARRYFGASDQWWQIADAPTGCPTPAS